MEPVKDDSRPAVSGAAVDAFAERLKGEIGGSTAYDLATAAGNGSLRPLTSQVPILSSSVPLATGSSTPTGSGQQVTWDQLTKHQQQLYLQRKEMLQRQQQQQQQLLAASQASKKSGGISQGISFGALMPLLQAHLPPEQNQQLNSLYQKFKQSDNKRRLCERSKSDCWRSSVGDNYSPYAFEAAAAAAATTKPTATAFKQLWQPFSHGSSSNCHTGLILQTNA